ISFCRQDGRGDRSMPRSQRATAVLPSALLCPCIIRPPACAVMVARKARSMSRGIRRKVPARATWADSSVLRFTADASGSGRRGAMMLQKLSIRNRLLFLSGALILMIAGLTYYLTTKLSDNSRAVMHNAELAALIDLAQDVRNTFGQYRYWTTDL